MKKNIISILLLLACVFALCLSLIACKNNEPDPYRYGKITVGAMNGPTMIGLGKLYHDTKTDKNSAYTLPPQEASPDAIIAGLANKTYDAACLPANNAAILFNNGNVDVQVAAVNTLNVLYVIQKSGTPKITSLADLEGKTVHLPGQGSTPEFVFRYLLDQNNVKNVALEFEAEGATIATGLKTTNSKYDYAVLPQPAATAAVSGAGAAVQTLNLTDEWKKHNPDSDIVTGVLVVRTAYLKNNKATFDKFLEDYKASVEFMTAAENIETTAQYVVDMGVVSQIQIAKNALQKCGITFIDKAAMKKLLVDFYTVLYGQNVHSIGGKLPIDSFYYV